MLTDTLVCDGESERKLEEKPSSTQLAKALYGGSTRDYTAEVKELRRAQRADDAGSRGRERAAGEPGLAPAWGSAAHIGTATSSHGH